ncbi:hypothetical protein ACOSQ4_002154 [Xanthoceras sorbifolium]
MPKRTGHCNYRNSASFLSCTGILALVSSQLDDRLAGGLMLTRVAPEVVLRVFFATICSVMALLNMFSLIWLMKDLL